MPLPAASAGAAASAPPSTSAARANDIDAAPSIVESARYIQTPDRTEMHVGLRSESLGQVNVHAVMTNAGSGATAASIAVQDHATHAMLVRDLPALQSHLQERNIHLDKITVIPDLSSAGSGTQRQSGSSQESQGRQPRTPYAGTPADSSPTILEQDQPLAVSWNSTGGRLSIRA
jgi:flagellar hook-length control protein FliK